MLEVLDQVLGHSLQLALDLRGVELETLETVKTEEDSDEPVGLALIEWRRLVGVKGE